MIVNDFFLFDFFFIKFGTRPAIAETSLGPNWDSLGTNWDSSGPTRLA
jgi:hypothetical protein